MMRRPFARVGAPGPARGLRHLRMDAPNFCADRDDYDRAPDGLPCLAQDRNSDSLAP